MRTYSALAFGCTALFAVAIATASAQTPIRGEGSARTAGAMPPKTSPPPPPPPPPPRFDDTGAIGTYQSRLVHVQDDQIERRYAEALQAYFADTENPAEQARRVLASAAEQDTLTHNRAIIASGEFAGRWQFLAPDGGLPTRAWRDIDRSDHQGYDAERIGYCRGDTAACEAWYESERHRAPEPTQGFVWDRPHIEWRNRMLIEPSAPSAERRPSLALLETAASRSGVASTRFALTVVMNPCGEVRSAWVTESSGDRDVDRAALQWAQWLLMPSAVAGRDGRGTVGRMPFQLHPYPASPESMDASPAE